MVFGNFRDIHTFGCYVVIYDVLSRHFEEKWNLQPTPRTLLAGGFAGTLTWAMVIFIDVVKSRIQADNPKNPRYCCSLMRRV